VNFELLQLQPEIFNSGEWLSVLSGLLVSVVACIYAWQIFATKLQVNIATWSMILLLDIVGLFLALRVGNTQPFMHIGWVFFDLLICVAALLNEGNWKWRRTESVSTVFCSGAILLWIIAPPLWSIYAYLTACVFALFPQARYYWFDEGTARKSSWVWLASSIAIVMTLYAIPVVTPEYLTVTGGLLIMYLSMAYLAFR
jgi:hypothetical protein